MHPPTPPIALTTALLLLTACPVVTSRPNPDHCWNAAGDATCEVHFAGAAPYCTTDLDPCGAAVPFGCATAQPSPECYSPCGGGLSAIEDSTCIAGSEDESVLPDLGPPDLECSADSDCEPSAPHCLANTCVECLDASECVGICDAQSECIACTRHDQCPNEAGCDLTLGRCLDPARVLHVGPEYEHPDLQSATLALALAGGSGTIVVHPKGQAYAGLGITISEGQVVVIRAPVDDVVVLAPSEQAFFVTGRLFLEHLRLEGVGGITIDGGLVHARSIVVVPSQLHAVECLSGELQLENSMLVGVVEASDLAVPIDIAGDCRVALLGTSVFSSHGPALRCKPGDLRAHSRIRKSLLVSADDLGIACVDEDLVVTPHAEYPGVDSGWFVAPFAGDLHLAAGPDLGPLFVNDWLPGDPLVDLDAQPRSPQDLVGADVPYPP